MISINILEISFFIEDVMSSHSVMFQNSTMNTFLLTTKILRLRISHNIVKTPNDHTKIVTLCIFKIFFCSKNNFWEIPIVLYSQAFWLNNINLIINHSKQSLQISCTILAHYSAAHLNLNTLITELMFTLNLISMHLSTIKKLFEMINQNEKWLR